LKQRNRRDTGTVFPGDKPVRRWPYFDKRFIIVAVGLVIVIAVPLTVYYAMSYNSVNGSTVQIASVRRSVSRGFFSDSISSVTYYVEPHVWSYATSLDTRVSDPRFSLIVDSYSINGVQAESGTFKPNGYLIYSLTFTTSDGTVASAVGQATSNYLILGMDALVAAGTYQNQITLSDSGTETFQS
jgi:hypothetical protein